MSTQQKKRQAKLQQNVVSAEKISTRRRIKDRKKNAKVKKNNSIKEKPQKPIKQQRQPQVNTRTHLGQQDEVRFAPAKGTRHNIMVTPIIDVQSVLGYCVGMLSYAMVKGFNNYSTAPLYDAYQVLIDDFLKRAGGATPTVHNRLRYVHDLLSSLEPKDIPFKQGTVSYAWKGLDAVTPSPNYVVRGYNTCFFVRGSGTLGGYDVWIPPNVNPIEECIPTYSDVMILLSDSLVGNLKYEESSSPTILSNDVSAFCGNTSYYGNGNAPVCSGFFSSVESEVPFKTRSLGVFTGYNQDDTKRVSRVLEVTSGDSCSTFSFPLSGYPRADFYRNAVPVIYCPLDLDEVCYYLEKWYLELVNKFASTSSPFTTNELFIACSPFQDYSAQQFRILVRQHVLSYFADQASVQFLTYSGDDNGFEPFRCGTNCFPLQKTETALRMPSALIENLRMLAPRSYDYATNNYHSKHNRIVYRPVWGIYKSVVNNPINLSGTMASGEGFSDSLLFLGTGANDPNPIDGFRSGQCLDLNSGMFDLFAAEWNSRVNTLSAQASSTGVLAGSSEGSLLYHTRFVKYVDDPIGIKVSQYPEMMRRSLQKQYIQRRLIQQEGTPSLSKDKAVRTNSAKKEDVYEDYYVPPAFALDTQDTIAYASFMPITSTTITLLNQLILPSYYVNSINAPTQQQIRVATMASYIEVIANRTDRNYKTRAFALDAIAKLSAPGIGSSTNSDEFIAAVKAMNETNGGGFIGDMIAALAPMATRLPF